MIEIYSQHLDGTWFAIALNKQRIVTSSFGANEQTTLNNILSRIPFNSPFQVFCEPTVSAKTLLGFLTCIYEGKATQTDLPLATAELSAYTKRVLEATKAIPVGYVSTYGGISKAVGGGPRAVGNIMAGNPFAPIVPCHRVVKSDFTLGGYGGGLRVKMELLRREKRGFVEAKIVPAADSSLGVFPVEYVLAKFA